MLRLLISSLGEQNEAFPVPVMDMILPVVAFARFDGADADRETAQIVSVRAPDGKIIDINLMAAAPNVPVFIEDETETRP